MNSMTRDLRAMRLQSLARVLEDRMARDYVRLQQIKGRIKSLYRPGRHEFFTIYRVKKAVIQVRAHERRGFTAVRLMRRAK